MTLSTLRPRRSALAFALAAALALVLAGTATAGAATVVKKGRAGGASVVVNAHGRTLYVLTPETARHVLCNGSCLSAWVPLRTGKSTTLKAGSGVKGKLGRLSRGGGSYQVTLRGLPVYTYIGDAGAGSATGDGLRSFGGTWHVIRPGG